MHKYTEALNYLTGKQNHKHDVGDLTIVHWAVDSRPEVYDTYNDIFNQLIYGSPPDKLENESIETIVSKIRKGTVSSDDINNFFDEHNPNVEFYIVGLTQPSKGRISVKFILHSQFGQLFRNIVQHQQDLKTAHSDKIISLYQISQELSPPIKTNEKNKKTDEEKKKSQNAINFPLVTKLLYSVLNGYRYPNFLLQTVVRRIQLDSDTKDNQYIKMNDTRVGILKACINRDARLSGKEEKIKMALDLEYKNPAYLCGRLFAVLEDIQYKTYKASGRELNRTISDTYFTSASTRPATVFPRLIDMAKVYMAKPESSKYKLRDDERIGQIANELEHKYPNTLSLEEQGIFILGYYQQKQYIKDQISAYKEEK
jgi:CRISPR-associated protein Csd1